MSSLQSSSLHEVLAAMSLNPNNPPGAFVYDPSRHPAPFPAGSNPPVVVHPVPNQEGPYIVTYPMPPGGPPFSFPRQVSQIYPPVAPTAPPSPPPAPTPNMSILNPPPPIVFPHPATLGGPMMSGSSRAATLTVMHLLLVGLSARQLETYQDAIRAAQELARTVSPNDSSWKTITVPWQFQEYSQLWQEGFEKEFRTIMTMKGWNI